MVLFSEFFKDKKRARENKKTFCKFVSMFGRVSKELNLINTSATPEMIFTIFNEIGLADNSADVFIQLVILVHTLPTSSGITILKKMGIMSNRGDSIDTIVNSLRYEEMESVSKMISKLMPEIRELVEEVDEKISKEPMRLLVGFYRHNDYLKEKVLFQEEEDFKYAPGGPGSIIERRRGGDLVKRLKVYNKDIDRVGRTRVLDDWF